VSCPGLVLIGRTPTELLSFFPNLRDALLMPRSEPASGGIQGLERGPDDMPCTAAEASQPPPVVSSRKNRSAMRRRDEARTPALRPIGTYSGAIYNDRFTSILLKNPLFRCQHLGFVAMSARQILALHLMWRRWVPDEG
jgi:hypothetical protein